MRRILFFLANFFNLTDSITTWAFINTRGLEHEANPIAVWLISNFGFGFASLLKVLWILGFSYMFFRFTKDENKIRRYFGYFGLGFYVLLFGIVSFWNYVNI